jgi:signal transduction histidine kinase
VLSSGLARRGRPLLADYVDRLVADLGSAAQRRAGAGADAAPADHACASAVRSCSGAARTTASGALARQLAARGVRLLVRNTADGHRVELGLNLQAWRDRPALLGLDHAGGLLLLTALAYLCAAAAAAAGRHPRRRAALRPRRFDQSIPVRRRDELGDLAGDVNTMAASIHQMLEAKRGLLLAISHELRSPLTRARLHTELLPEAGEPATRREALLRDLQEMADLVGDLLESERLGAAMRRCIASRPSWRAGARSRRFVRGRAAATRAAGAVPDPGPGSHAHAAAAAQPVRQRAAPQRGHRAAPARDAAP